MFAGKVMAGTRLPVQAVQILRVWYGVGNWALHGYEYVTYSYPRTDSQAGLYTLISSMIPSLPLFTNSTAQRATHEA